VPQPKTLTERQLEVLGWIGASWLDDVMVGVSYRITAAALRGRGLVKIDGRGPTWSTSITDAGRALLSNWDSSNPSPLRPANGSVTEQLVADVIEAGGSLEVARRHYGGAGVDYVQRARAAERYGKVPAGKRLVVTPLSFATSRIDIIDAPTGTALELRPVPVPRMLTRARYHSAVRTFFDSADRHDISRAALPRVLRLLQALAGEADRRGFRVANERADPSSRGSRGLRRGQAPGAW